MRFLWFGKKKSALTPEVVLEPQREPEEIFSVTGYICETNPITNAKNAELNAHTINSLLLSIYSQSHDPADVAAQEFFQERGAIVLPVTDYSLNVERGISARVFDGDIKRTVLVGSPSVISRASTPFSDAIAAAVASSPRSLVVAIDGIAYANFEITKEILYS